MIDPRHDDPDRPVDEAVTRLRLLADAFDRLGDLRQDLRLANVGGVLAVVADLAAGTPVGDERNWKVRALLDELAHEPARG